MSDELPTSTGLIVIENQNRQVALEDPTAYGHRLRRATLCPVCSDDNANEINLMRARDFLSLEQIRNATGFSEDTLDLHFRNHFIVHTSRQRMIDLRENSVPEANELVKKIFEKDLDLFSGAQSVLDSKAERLHGIRSRIHTLTDRQEADALDEVEVSELYGLNKLAEDIENSILKTWQMVDKKLFPFRKEELQNAILDYKLNVLTKMLDKIQLTLMEFERRGEDYRELIHELRRALASQFNQIEDEILKSGGVINARTPVSENIGGINNEPSGS